MYPRQVLELVDGGLLARDAELVLELPRRRNAHSELVLLLLLLLKVVEWVGAAGIRPHIRECNLLGCALLQQELAVRRAEDKGGERAMQEALPDVLHKVACRWFSQTGHERVHLRIHVFLSSAPMGRSCSSTIIHLSSIRRDCSTS